METNASDDYRYEFCLAYPCEETCFNPFSFLPDMCCQIHGDPTCEACQEKILPSTYCCKHSDEDSCQKYKPVCPTIYSPEGLACPFGVHPITYCSVQEVLPDDEGEQACEGEETYEAGICCKSIVVGCLACQANVNPIIFCTISPGTIGCSEVLRRWDREPVLSELKTVDTEQNEVS